MIKKIVTLIFTIVGLNLFAATNSNVGMTTTTPNDYAELDINSPDQNTGVLIPIMTSANIEAISSPANGLLVYNSEKNKFMYNAGTTSSPIWTFVGSIPIVNNRSSITISEPTDWAGVVIYDKSDNRLYYYNETSWVAFEQ